MTISKKDGYTTLLFLIIVYFLATALRLMATLILGKYPFWDPAEYLYAIQTYPDYSPGYYPGFFAILIITHTFTGLPLIPFVRFFPPILHGLTIFPFFLSARELLRDNRSGLIASLLFAVTDIAVLRQSYLIPEGLALFFMILTIYLVVKTIYSQRFKEFLALTIIVFFCLGSLHNLTSTMTLIVILPPLLIYPFIRQRKSVTLVETSTLNISQLRQCILVTLAITCIWLYWVKEFWYIGFVSSFITVNLDAIFTVSTGQTPSSEEFLEHHMTTRELTFMDLAVMNGGSILIFVLGALGVLRALKSPKNDYRKIIALSWVIIAFINFALNIIIDSLFSPQTYGQQAYRAWVFLIIPLIFFASKKLNTIRRDDLFKVLLISILLVCITGSKWFIEYLMASFPV